MKRITLSCLLILLTYFVFSQDDGGVILSFDKNQDSIKELKVESTRTSSGLSIFNLFNTNNRLDFFYGIDKITKPEFLEIIGRPEDAKRVKGAKSASTISTWISIGAIVAGGVTSYCVQIQNASFDVYSKDPLWIGGTALMAAGVVSVIVFPMIIFKDPITITFEEAKVIIEKFNYKQKKEASDNK